MKVLKNKNEKINLYAKNAIKNFNAKRIISNILYHKIFLGMCLIINICIFIFILIYNNQIQKLEALTNRYTKDFMKNDNFLNEQRSSIEHKLVNLISINKRNNLLFAYSFANKSEYEMIINFIREYFNSEDNIQFKLQLIYQSCSFDNSYLNKVDILNNQIISLFIIQTLDDKKFGIYFEEPILFNEKNEFISTGNRLFIFSFKSKSMHKYIGKGPALKISKNKFIELGDEEIVINGYFYNNGGYINFPLKNFENLNGKDNIFTQKKGNFDIKNIEIFSINLYSS